MPNLELKIPPLALVFIYGVLMKLAAIFAPTVEFLEGYKTISLTLLSALGLFFVLSGVISFRSASTTVNPTTPQASTALVKSGIYKITRNPMYVGFLFLLVGWGLFLSSTVAVILAFSFVAYMNRFQIKPEERALESIFGNEYINYKQHVRRWL